MSVTLREVTKENVRAICDLPLAPGQERFVAPPATTIAECAYEEHVMLRAIYDGDEPAGVLALVEEPGEPPFLVRLMVAADRQGRGIGRAAVSLLMTLLRERGETELTTSHGVGEGSPAGFYAALGFEPTGDVVEGERVMRIALTG
jgi:diamine N-acetyltransferase